MCVVVVVGRFLFANVLQAGRKRRAQKKAAPGRDSSGTASGGEGQGQTIIGPFSHRLQDLQRVGRPVESLSSDRDPQPGQAK